jgi:tripartite-type tricarboxylate transporter receptor subunit TctC
MKTIITSTALLLSVAASNAALAQDRTQDRKLIAPNYPIKPIRMMTTVTAGGGLDFITRTVANKLSERLPAPVVVENVSGANGIIAVNTTINSAPDGYTLLSTGGSMAINSVFKKFEKDVRTAVVPVAQMSSQPYMIYVPVSSPISTIKDLLAEAKKNPGKLTYGSTGIGSVIHLGMEIIEHQGGVDMIHIPYKGSAAPIADLTSGRLSVYMASFVSGRALVKAGKLKSIAVTSAQRSSEAPDVPTVAESGIPNYDVTNTYTLYVNGATPLNIVNALNGEVAQSLADPELRKAFAKDNSKPAPPRSVDELKKILLDEIGRWEGVVKSANIKLEH